MNRDKLINALGLVAKSNNFVYGEKMLELFKKSSSKVKLVVVTSDISQNSLKKIANKCQTYQIQLIIIKNSSDDLDKVLHIKNIKAIGIIDTNLAKLIMSNI